jgi:sporulation integral membrane protein YtvI
LSGLFTKRTILIVLTIILIVLLGYWILPVSVPLIIAFVTALLLEPAVRLLQQRVKLKRSLSVSIIFIIFLLLMALGSYFLITKVIAEAIQIIENAPIYINEINRVLLDVEQNLYYRSQDLPPELVEVITRQVEDTLYTFQTELLAYVNIENLKSLLTEIPSYLVSFIVYLIALFLLLLEMPNLKEKVFTLFTSRTVDKVNFMTSRLSYVFFGFIKAQFLVSIIIFVTSFVGLLIIAPDVALMMAFIIWIIDVIPIIGSIVIMGPWALFHFITGDIVLGTELAILGVILLVIRRTIEPKVMGSHIGLSPLSTLIAMYLGLKLIGILGFIIGPLLLIAFNSAREAGIIKFNFKI